MSDCLFAAARSCLDAATVDAKLALTETVAAQFAEGRLAPRNDAPMPRPIGMPGRPPRPRLVHPRELPRRGFGSAAGRAAFLHAVAHIEFNAIDLGWDAVYRFRGMPDAFYADWVGVAADEARHFRMLQARLAEHGHAYGDFDAHNGLWEMAEKTAHDVLERMALVPRVLEARGLDVTPGMIDKLRALGDDATVAILEVILREEVAHVAAGSRWYQWCCTQRGIDDPQAMFRQLLGRHARDVLHGPFNLDARRRAGFSDTELDSLMQLDARPR
ncbi:MAG: ferritin-like domain-containing protein [Pseudoxanthomonas suwonensis]|nr:ferritin-like domain-containing protein [Pseudoxanthomonas suwonensis]